MNKAVESLQTRLNLTVARWNTSLRRFYVVRVLLDGVKAFNADNMPLYAASLSYYTLLALFPLLLLFIAIASPFLAQQEILALILRYVAQTLPGASSEIDSVLKQVLDARGPATIIGVLALLWSASGVFDVVQTALDRAWRVSKARTFVQQRIFSVVAISLLGGLFILSLFISTLTDDVIRAALAWTDVSVAFAGRITSFIAVLLAFVILYKFFPHARVNWTAALIGAFTAAFLWEIAKSVYGIYLIQFARFSLVYGSVGAVIGLLLWGYISATILLFGAELSATIERERKAE